MDVFVGGYGAGNPAFQNVVEPDEADAAGFGGCIEADDPETVVVAVFDKVGTDPFVEIGKAFAAG